MFKFIIKLFGKFCILKKNIFNIICSFIPSHIKSCYNITFDNISKVDKTIYINNDIYNRYYLFHIWDRKSLVTQYLYINEHILQNICNCNYININKYTNILNNYIKTITNMYKDNIFHIEINGKDVNKQLYKYKKSFNIPYNINGLSLYMLNNLLNKRCNKYEKITVKIVDYSLDENIYNVNDYIINRAVLNMVI